jgi:hypothetical protein
MGRAQLSEASVGATLCSTSFPGQGTSGLSGYILSVFLLRRKAPERKDGSGPV